MKVKEISVVILFQFVFFGQVIPEGIEQCAANGYQALFIALAEDAHLAEAPFDIGFPELLQLIAAHAGGIKQLADEAVGEALEAGVECYIPEQMF